MTFATFSILYVVCRCYQHFLGDFHNDSASVKSTFSVIDTPFSYSHMFAIAVNAARQGHPTPTSTE